MNDQMDQAARFLRDRAGARAPKASHTTAAHGGGIIINGNVGGNVILGHGKPAAASAPRWMRVAAWLGVVAVCLLLAWSVAAAAPVTTSWCQSVIYPTGAQVTSCVAVAASAVFRPFQVSPRDQVLAVLTSAANACFSGFSSAFSQLYPTSSSLSLQVSPHRARGFRGFADSTSLC